MGREGTLRQSLCDGLSHYCTPLATAAGDSLVSANILGRPVSCCSCAYTGIGSRPCYMELGSPPELGPLEAPAAAGPGALPPLLLPLCDVSRPSQNVWHD